MAQRFICNDQAWNLWIMRRDINLGKYDDLVFEIKPEHHNWYGKASPRGFFRGTTALETARVYIDFTAIEKEQLMELPHTHHCADEYIVFSNADLGDFFGFDAEIEIWLGDDPEKLELYTITEPTIIRIPPKLYHCPVNFKRTTKPVLFSAMYLDGDWSKINRRVNDDGTEDFLYDGAGIRRCVNDRSKECIYCGLCFSEARKKALENENDHDSEAERLAPYYEMAKLPKTGKFDKYVYAFTKEKHDDDRFFNPRAGFRGVEEMENSRLCYLYDIVQKACEIGDAHMHHAVEEYLFFMGANVAKFFEFDAEIEIDIGDSPYDMETYRFDKPTVVRIPAGVWHGPVKFKRVGAPICFLPLYPSGNYGKIIVNNGGDGGGEYLYKGNDLP